MNFILLIFWGLSYWLFKIEDVNNVMKLFVIIQLFTYSTYGLLVFKILTQKKVNYLAITITGIAILVLYLFTLPASSNDMYRYFWDGWLTRSGVNPYLVTPQDSGLTYFHNSNLYKLVNWKANYTPYPPLAQYIFVIAYSLYSIFGIVGGKIPFLIPVIITAYVIYKHVDKRLYAIFILNPLLSFEAVQAGHIDVYAMLFLFLGIYLYYKERFNYSSFFLACATLTKIYPGFFLPFFFLDLLRRKKYKESINFTLIPILLAVIFYMPFITKSLFPITRYVFLMNEQEYNASFYRYFYQILTPFIQNPKQAAATLCTLGFVSVYLLLLRRKLSINLLIAVAISYLAFSTMVFQWYTLIFIPLVILEVRRSGNSKPLIGLILMQFIITCIYYEPKWKLYREWMLNTEYAILILTIVLSQINLTRWKFLSLSKVFTIFLKEKPS